MKFWYKLKQLRHRLKKLWKLTTLGEDDIINLYTIYHNHHKIRRFLSLELKEYSKSEIAADVCHWSTVPPELVGSVIAILYSRSNRGKGTLEECHRLWRA